MLSAAHAMTQTVAAVRLPIGADYSKPWQECGSVTGACRPRSRMAAIAQGDAGHASLSSLYSLCDQFPIHPTSAPANLIIDRADVFDFLKQAHAISRFDFATP